MPNLPRIRTSNRLSFETLEKRQLMAAELGRTGSPDRVGWFASFDDVPRVAIESLDQIDRNYADAFVGPRELAVGEWLVQLTDDAISLTRQLQSIDQFIDSTEIDATVISGLGSPGHALVRISGMSQSSIEASLANNPNVAAHSLNSSIYGQTTEPNEDNFLGRQLIGLDAVNASTAWDVTRGSLSTVVGVVDSGVDPTHPDLYLNIWLNQGEIPQAIRDALVDIDDDGLITFYDLNNVTVGQQAPFEFSTADFLTGPNAGLVTDINRNGYIDAIDLLRDPRWADGQDNDDNEFFDDLFGVNFRTGANDTLERNNPSDVLGHGTHVAGTLGAIGNNGFGTVGLNWQVSIMSLRILDNNNVSDAGAAIRAVNYATMMRNRLNINGDGETTEGAYIRVLNNSWGQTGGRELALEAAISDLGDAGVLFVAAAGNGNLFGEGVNNDLTEFFPAGYDLPNVISVAASTSDNRLANFSNFGMKSVDLVAPGVGILSTLRDGSFGTANGTSMAVPHVAGTAALIWSALPTASVAEVRAAILSTVDKFDSLTDLVATGGRLNAGAAINANVFAPIVTSFVAADIDAAGGTDNKFTVTYFHRAGIDVDSISDGDFVVDRQWGPATRLPVTLDPDSTPQRSEDGTSVTATYVVLAPGEGAVSGGGSETTFLNNTTILIPDNRDVLTTSTIDVIDVPIDATAISVVVNISHTYVGDLNLTLVSPTGGRAVLFNNLGSSGDDISNTRFSDFALTPIALGSAPYLGEFQPAEPLAGLINNVVDGTWTLEITDTGGGDEGQLLDWALVFSDRFASSGGVWDPFDFGDYVISSVAGEVQSMPTSESELRNVTDARVVGSFHVEVIDDSFIYVDVESDAPGNAVPGRRSLRDAIIEANAAAPDFRTIILDTGNYSIDIDPVADPFSTFPDPDPALFCGAQVHQTGWSNESTGDFDITGNISIFGNQNDFTVIDAKQLDRVFKVHPGAALELNRVTVTGGVSPVDQGGGGILSAGSVLLNQSNVSGNVALGASDASPIRGGGIAAWQGNLSISESWIADNEANFGGGVFYCGPTFGNVTRSTLSNNRGGGLHSSADFPPNIDNSTFSSNTGDLGAIFNGTADGQGGGEEPADIPPPPLGRTTTPDFRFSVFASSSDTFVPGDTNGFSDVFVFDSFLGTAERVSVSSSGEQANGPSDESSIVLISADGRFVFFQSEASNLVPDDNNGMVDIFAFDRTTRTIERVSVSESGQEADGVSGLDSISADGRFVTINTIATNLASESFEFDSDFLNFKILLIDRDSNRVDRVERPLFEPIEDFSFSFTSRVSDDGQLVAFSSNADNLVTDDTNALFDVFVYDNLSKTTERVSVTSGGQQGEGDSFLTDISPDGRYVYFGSNAPNLDPFAFLNVLVHDRQTGETVPFFNSPGVNQLFANQITVIDSRRSAPPSIQGSVRLTDSLLAVRSIPATSSRTTLENVIGPERFGATFVTPLTRTGFAPPIHSPLTGNPAIDFNSLFFNFTDQVGTPRDQRPDAGAVEAFAGNFEGAIYVDLNANQRRDRNEPGFTDAPIFVRQGRSQIAEGARIDGVVLRDNPATPEVDEAGSFRFENLAARSYDLRIVEPENFKFSTPAIAEVFKSNGPISTTFNASVIAFSSSARNLVANDNNNVADIFLEDRRTGTVERISRGINGEESNGNSSEPSTSDDGRFTVFVSSANNLVADDNNGVQDVFIYDRQGAVTRRILGNDDFFSLEPDGPSFAPMISGDGRFVVFQSNAANLSSADLNGSITDIFIYDVQRQLTILAVPLVLEGQGEPGPSITPSISTNGNVIAFSSLASNFFIPLADVFLDLDLNGVSDVFIYDVKAQFLDMASFGFDGSEANGASHSPSLTDDGLSVAFVSEATNLVPIDGNGFADIFVFTPTPQGFDRAGEMDLITFGFDGSEANGPSHSPAISGQGRFVTFVSAASNLVDDDDNGVEDVFVFDRDTRQIRRLSVAVDGTEANGSSTDPVISPDGRVISFNTLATNLVADSTNTTGSTIIVSNPLIEAGARFTVKAGDRLTGVEYGLVPDVGIISGRVFVDDLVENGVSDQGELGLGGIRVFLDANGNRIFDEDEAQRTTDAEGRYQFDAVPSFRDYKVAITVPSGFSQASPGAAQTFTANFFLPAGGNIGNRDFALRPVSGTGQANGSSISGRIFDDVNGNGMFDEDIDVPRRGVSVFLDVNNDRMLTGGAGERPETTDDRGIYRFTGLGSQTVSVATVLDETVVHTQPLGSNFAITRYPVFNDSLGFENPQAIATADFDRRNGPDVAVLIGDRNSIAIRLNNGSGQFNGEVRIIDLAPVGSIAGVSQPQDFIVGQFNGDGSGVDIAVVGLASNNVLVLLDYDPTTNRFASRISVPVGVNPFDITIGDFNNDDSPDLAVVNRGIVRIVPGSQPPRFIKDNDESFNILINDGSGRFTAGAAIPVPGDNPNSIVAADFSGDGVDDIVILHPTPSRADSPFGDVALFVNNGTGTLTHDGQYYPVQGNPIELVVGDFNGDLRPDLAVSNAGTNSITILSSTAAGGLQVEPALVGTTTAVDRMSVGDIDGDGDLDIVASRVNSRELAIFRNTSVVGGAITFQPLEGIGLANATSLSRSPVVLANFDNDTSGPGNTGTLDIVAIPQRIATNQSVTEINVLANTLVNGSHRIVLTGTNAIVGLDFMTQSTPVAPVAIAEDSGPQSISFSVVEQGRSIGPTPRFTVISSNTSIIASGQVVHVSAAASAQLQFSTVLNANTQNTDPVIMTVQIIDAGADGVNDTADDITLTRRLTVTVAPVNDPPAFTVPASTSVARTAGAQSIAGFVTNISPGGANDEATQTLDAFAIVTDASFFTTAPQIDATGRLTFVPSPAKSGSVNVEVSLADNGGLASNGLNRTTKTFAINVLPVNTAPTFTLGANTVVNADDGAQTRPNFAAGFMSGGGPDDAGQLVSDYVIAVDQAGLFAVLPDISNSGQLTFTPSPTAAGVATVTVRVRDNGGALNGGSDLSIAQTFTITIEPGAALARAIVLQGEGETVEMISLGAAALARVDMIDIRGTGNNQAILNSSIIAASTPNRLLTAIANAGDAITFDAGWVYNRNEVTDGQFRRIFVNGLATAAITGPLDWTNPIDRFDVTGNGRVDTSDALAIVNAVARSRNVTLEDQAVTPIPRTRIIGPGNVLANATLVEPSAFRFYDVSGDNRAVLNEALSVINEIARRRRTGASGEGESSIAAPSIASPSVQSPPPTAVRSGISTEEFTDSEFNVTALDSSAGNIIGDTQSVKNSPAIEIPLDDQIASPSNVKASSELHDTIFRSIENWLV